MSNIKQITSTTTGHAMDTTPLLGGLGREAKAHLGANTAVTTGILLEGCDKTETGAAPAADDPRWASLVSGAADLSPVVEIADLPDFVRLGPAATDPISLEGVQ